MSLYDFLEAFYPDESERICFRVVKPKDAPESANNYAMNISYSRSELLNNENLIQLRKLNHLRGLYFIVNVGGNTDNQISRFNAVFVENDTLPIEEQHKALDKCPLPPSIRVETKKSVHSYWLLNSNCTETDWRDIQSGLIAYFDGDKAIKNPARLMRLPFFQHLTYNEEATGSYEYK